MEQFPGRRGEDHRKTPGQAGGKELLQELQGQSTCDPYSKGKRGETCAERKLKYYFMSQYTLPFRKESPERAPPTMITSPASSVRDGGTLRPIAHSRLNKCKAVQTEHMQHAQMHTMILIRQ